MKLLIIAPINSIHTVRWVNSLVNHVDCLVVASMHGIVEKIDTRIVYHKLPYSAPIGYFLNYRALKRIIKAENPDMIHTHFMSGYGTLSSLAVNKKRYPHLLSMWGSDIYDFPNKSPIHKALIKWASNKATCLASTSHVMKRQFYKIYPKFKNAIAVTPFGVDTELFRPDPEKKDIDVFNIGIAKNMEDKYGVKYLIEGFSEFNRKLPKSKLHIIGSGSKLDEMKVLAKSLNISQNVNFHGRVNNAELPDYLNSWDVSVVPSILDSESFGVSAVEASACGLPVIVSNVGGLPEVVDHMKTGIVVPARDSGAIAQELEFLFKNKEIMASMGSMGREKVLENYSWEKSVAIMVSLYNKMQND